MVLIAGVQLVDLINRVLPLCVLYYNHCNRDCFLYAIFTTVVQYNQYYGYHIQYCNIGVIIIRITAEMAVFDVVGNL